MRTYGAFSCEWQWLYRATAVCDSGCFLNWKVDIVQCTGVKVIPSLSE